jgi:hypothetical protein
MTLTWDVLIPAYEAEATIAAAVSSALGQELPPSRVVVYDDGSRDRTVDRARAAGAEVVVGGENRGVGHARQELLRLTRASWVQMLDADDRLLPHASRLFEAAAGRHPDAWLLGFGEVTGTAAAVPSDALPGGEPVGLRRLWWRNRFITSSCLLRPTAALEVGGFPRVRQLEDYALWLRLAAQASAGGRLWVYETPVTARAIDSGSLTGDVRGAVLAERRLLPQYSDAALATLPSALRRALVTLRLSTLWWRGLSRHTDYGRAPSAFLPPGEVVPGVLAPRLLQLAASEAFRGALRSAARLGRTRHLSAHQR